MKNNISKLTLTSITTIIIFVLCVMIESITTITVNAATTYSVVFPVNNGCKIAYYQEYDPKYPDHDGIDIHSSGDDTIYAAYAGTVVQIGDSCPHVNELSNHLNGKYDEMGNYIKIKGNDGIYYWYYHLKQHTMVVSKNDKVVAGQPIATMGSSGASSGKHLHFRMTTGSGYYSTAVIANPVGKYSGVVNYKNGPYNAHESLNSVAVKFHRNLNSSDSTTVTETFTVGVSNQKFGYKTDGTGKYSYMNEPHIGFGKWINPGYELLGWSFDKNATTASYNTYSPVVDSWIKNNSPSADLYAVWKKSELDSISISTAATKQSYWKYEKNINTSGLVLTAKYSDGTTKNISSGFTASGNFSVTGFVPVTISYTEGGVTKTTSYNVTISHPFNGEGTKENPYTISDATELKRLSRVINDVDNYTELKSYNSAYYLQTADIDLVNEEFTPIGNFYKGTTFNGKYNGDNHSITGLNVNCAKTHAGLFGRINASAVISNLAVSGNIIGGENCIGGIAGEIAYGGKIQNCCFNGTVTGPTYVGGIAGRLIQGGEISNSYANAQLKSTAEDGIAGGIVPEIVVGSKASSVDASLNNLYFAGTINAAKYGAIIESEVKDTVKECEITYSNLYSVNTLDPTNISNCKLVDEENLKALNNVTLGDAFTVASANQNDGYPIFTWQFEALIGDVNNDGSIRLSDLTELKKFLVGMDANINFRNSDICPDNKINVFDWITLKNLL